jgi:hypothetical protein
LRLLALGVGSASSTDHPDVYVAGLEGARERLDLGMARCAAPYGREDLSPRTTVELVCYYVVTVTGTGQVG